MWNSTNKQQCDRASYGYVDTVQVSSQHNVECTLLRDDIALLNGM